MDDLHERFNNLEAQISRLHKLVLDVYHMAGITLVCGTLLYACSK